MEETKSVISSLGSLSWKESSIEIDKELQKIEQNIMEKSKKV